ncbi:MAG: zinc metallopeptidase [Pirellulaceae bacterium]
MYFFDSMYFLLVLIPSLLIAGGANMLVRSAFNKYSKVGMRSGMSGGEAARLILDKAGLYNVAIQSAHGRLSDHYDPRTQTLALSADVLNGRSLAAVGVAAHEAGHALQHAKNYAPLHVRSALVPLAGVLSPIGFYAMFLGLFLSKYLVLAGVILFGSVLLFQLVTLPVEFDASARAKRQLVEHGIVGTDEMTGVHAVLNAAALTYVAAVMSTLLTMVYYLWRSGLIGGRR